MAQQDPSQTVAAPATARYLEHITKSIMQAINDRQFDPEKKPWTLMAPQFRNDPTGRFDSAAFLPPSSAKPNLELTSHPGSKVPLHRPQTKEEHIQFHREMASGAPDYQNLVLDATATFVDEREGVGRVMMSTNTTGIPRGVVREAVSMLEFRKVRGEWLCTRLRTLPGYDVSGRGGL